MSIPIALSRPSVLPGLHAVGGIWKPQNVMAMQQEPLEVVDKVEQELGGKWCEGVAGGEGV